MKKKLINIFSAFFCSILFTAINAQSESFKLPVYEKFTLKNGLAIYLMEQHEVPMINVSVIIPAGAIYDGDKNGLASLTANGLMYGTKNYSKQKIEEELDFIGANINSGASKESASLSAKFASKDADKVLAIIQEVLISPVFNKEDFDKEKKRILVNLEQAKESPRNVIGNYFDKMFYGDHVYGNPVSGKISTVSLLTDEDLKSFYASNYIPNGTAIAVVGDFNNKEMKARLIQLFNGWQKGKKQSVNLASNAVKKQSGAKVLLVNKEDARETTFYIGAAGVERKNPDFVAIEVVNTILGGRFTSWLNDELRVNTGLTYGARSTFSSLKNAGTFYVSTFTANKNTEAAIDKTLEVLQKPHTLGIDEATLTSAKNYVKGQFPPRYETSGQLAGFLTQMFWYGFDESFINNFQKNVDGLTTEKTKEIIAKYFPKDKLQFVLFGKSSEIKKIAEKYGPVTEVQIKEEIKKAF